MIAVTDEQLERARQRIESNTPGSQDRLNALPQEKREIILAGDAVERCTADFKGMANSGVNQDGPEALQETGRGKLGLSGIAEELA